MHQRGGLANGKRSDKRLAELHKLGETRQFRRVQTGAVRAGLPTFSLAMFKHAQRAKLERAVADARAAALQQARIKLNLQESMEMRQE